MRMLTGDQSGLRRSGALLCKMVLAGAILCGAGSILEARAQMHTQTFELIEATIPQLQWALSAGFGTSHDLVAQYLARIQADDQHGPALNAISITKGQGPGRGRRARYRAAVGYASWKAGCDAVG
jgi:hypothetical protein